MRVLLISDGRPGHENLSLGIAAALGRRHTVTMERLHVDRGRWPGPVTALLKRIKMSPTRLLSLIYGQAISQLPTTDVVISAGAETLAANIAAARHLGAANIFYGSLRQFRPADFSLVLTSYERAAAAPNIVRTLKPSALDPDALTGNHHSGRLGLLVGGPTNGIDYGEADWRALEAVIKATWETANIRWVVSNSRRTPEVASNMLRGLSRQPNGPIDELIDVAAPDAPSLEGLLGKVDGVVCSADSSSMISEVVWARRRLLCLEPERFSLTANEADYRRWLAREGWLRNAKLQGMSGAAIQDELSRVTPRASNALDELAQLLERVPALHQ